ncbi:MAG: ABC transporter ATP-binding protein [Anaerolineaceae bacterium]|nr:ABC transporter ATP-binding protein [Anaerolineaceae bacterium]
MFVSKKLRELIRPYQTPILITILLLFFYTAIDMVFPQIIEQVIDRGLLNQDRKLLLQAAIIVVGLGLVKAFLINRRIYLSHGFAHKIAYDLRNRLYNHIQHLPFSYHDSIQSGQLISRCIEDVRSVQNFAASGFLHLMQVFTLMIGVMIMLFISNWKLAFIGMLPIIPLLFITVSFGRKIGQLFYVIDDNMGDVSSRLQENVIGAQVVRAFAREEFENKRFDGANQKLTDSHLDALREFTKVVPTTNFLVALSTILILWFGGKMVMASQLTIGELVAFNSYLLLFAQPAQQLSWLVNQAGEAAAGVKRTFEVLQTRPEIHSPHNAVPLPDVRGKVAFENVSFRYASEPMPALQHINLVVEPNQVVALIGPTGSGKTSLINLIPRFYDVDKGSVRIDGVDTRLLDLVTLRKQIGIVLQTSLLFSATIRENIAYGKPNLTMDDIINAAKAAQAHDFIMEMPEQYDTIVGERGTTLSGGQRQRIAIARAILLNPRILILDDSTSSVDMKTEKCIQEALMKLMEGRTTFVIAQRLSTVRRADLILVMQDGAIVERGTHEQLLKQDGPYREIYELQLREQEL